MNFNNQHAPDDGECRSPDTRVFSKETLQIQQLNDRLRIDGIGGTIVCTKGIMSLETDQIASIGDAVRSFDHFNDDNDPHGEHDCAVVSVGKFKAIFKIEYFDNSLLASSSDPTDPAKTKRIMSIMLAEEY